MNIFHEIQRFPKWIYLIMIPSLVMVISIMLYSYFNSGSEAEKQELLIVMAVVIIIEAISLYFISMVRQEVKIDRFGLYFKYPPFKNNFTQISSENIKSYDLDSYNRINYGYHRGKWNLLRREPSITMHGLEKVVRLHFNDGNTLLIGTKKPLEFIKALNILKEEINYEA